MLIHFNIAVFLLSKHRQEHHDSYLMFVLMANVIASPTKAIFARR